MEQNRGKKNYSLLWSMEFAIPSNRVGLVEKNLSRVKKLFKVSAILAESFHRDNTAMQWIQFMGGDATAEEMTNAKTFIISIANPEACISIDNFSAKLYNSVVEEVEMSTCAFLTMKNNSVEIYGSELAVVLAQSMLESFQVDDVPDEKCTNSKPATQHDASAPSQQLPASSQAKTRNTSPNPSSSCISSDTNTTTQPSTTALARQSSETTRVKTVDRYDDNAFLPIISASSSISNPSNSNIHPADRHIWLGNVNSTNSNKAATTATSSSVPSHSQLEYLKNLGQKHQYDMATISEGLRRCDMEDVIRPTEFLDILKDIKKSQGDSNRPPGSSSSKLPSSHGDGVKNRPYILSSSTEMMSVSDADASVIIIDEEERQSEEEDDDAIIISSDEDDHTESTSKTSKKNKNKKKQAKKDQGTHIMQTGKPNIQAQKTWEPNPPPLPFQGLRQPAFVPVTHNAVGSTTTASRRLRYIVIDGNNIAMAHGGNKVYSVRGIRICVDYFLARGHKVTVFVPETRRYSGHNFPIVGKQLLERMNEEGILNFTPARRIGNGQVIASYDDRFILNLADAEKGIVVSNDQFRDLLNAKPSYKEIIERRLLQFTFVGDHFMPPDDPLGRNGPPLDVFLQMPVTPGMGFPQQYGQHSHVKEKEEKGKLLLPLAYQQPRAYGCHISEEEKNIRLAQSKDCKRKKIKEETQQKEKSKNVDHGSGWVQPTQPPRPFAGGITSLPHKPNGMGKPRSKHPTISSDCRTDDQTVELFSQLSLMFSEPEQEPRLWDILRNHPAETDITRLTNYFLNAI